MKDPVVIHTKEEVKATIQMLEDVLDCIEQDGTVPGHYLIESAWNLLLAVEDLPNELKAWLRWWYELNVLDYEYNKMDQAAMTSSHLYWFEKRCNFKNQVKEALK